jgi:hypothetical protein
VGGACANIDQVKAEMKRANEWLQGKAVDASNFALQFPNATIFFAKNASIITNSTAVPAQDLSFWDKVANFFKSAWNYTKALFQTFSAWVVNLFSKSTNAINPCFQAWANITNGAHCVASSSNGKTKDIAATGFPKVFSVPANYEKAGEALVACLPLIDNYCSLSYGVSVTNASLPFNKTLNWGDGAIPVGDCHTIRSNTASFCADTSTNVCNVTLYTTLAKMFYTNWIPFVPTDASINNLGNFLSGDAMRADNFNATAATVPATRGFSLSQDTTESRLDVYALGKVSGQAGQYYKSAFTFITSFILALFALMV